MNAKSLHGRILVSCCLVALIAAVAFADTSTARSRIAEEDAHPRMTTSLQLLALEAQVGPQRLKETAGDLGIELENGDVVVIVEPASGRATRVDEIAVRALGGEVEARSESLLRVRVPADRLFDLADWVSGVAFIREPYEPRPLAVTSEGVSLTGAIAFHNAGYYGQGAKVAIIDLGFDGYTEAQANGELANVVYTWDYSGRGFQTDYVHGTGVGEIVEDMAPQADLYLMKVWDGVDLQNAVSDCIDFGVDVINHSVGWFNTNFYDGTGFIAGIATNARNNGILWCNSAGNDGDDGHWQGYFDDSDGDGYHDFDDAVVKADYVDGLGDGVDDGNRVYATGGDTIRVYMTWDDWTASDQDYDLHLYNSFGSRVASSSGWQTGSQPPTESIEYTVPTSGYYEIAIERYNAPGSPEIEFFTFRDFGGVGLEHHVPQSSIITPGNSTDVLTVGAIRDSNWTTGPQEAFSSQGPSNDSIYAPSRTKPDIAGVDGVTNYTYGSFYGTSASSPHVAGAAALLISEDPSRTADDLQTKLESDAIDMGAAGKDNVYGSGRLNLELDAAPPPPAGVVGYWEFNEGAGSTAADSSGNGNTGTVSGANWTETSPDESWALSFDGVNDYVQVPNAASLNPASALTIEAWIKPDVVPPASEKQQVIVEKPYTSAAAPYYQYCLTMWGTEIVLYVSVDGQLEYVVSTGAGLTAGTWTHVAGVYDGQDLKVYVDGTLRGTANVGAGTISAYSTPMLIGKHGNFAIDQFSGTMDEVRIHAEALVPGGFNLLPGEPPVGPTPPALVGDFNATDGEDRQSTLSWTNPADGDLGQVVVQRKTGSYPTSHTDGTTVYNDETPIPGAAISGEVDSSLVNETTYYYAVFSRDASDWDDTVTEGSNADTGAPTEPAPPGDAVGYWQLNEESGTTAADSSGNGNHGTIYGASWVSGSPDESWALSFDGVNDYVQVPNAASLNPASALTIEAWIKPDVVPPASEKQQVIVEKPYTSAAAPYYQYCLTMWGTEIVLYVSVDGQLEYVVSTGAGLTAGTWTHVAGVYDGQDLKVYVDGTLRGTANVGAGTISAYSTPMLIGKHGNFAIDQFSGTMDEVRIHAEALVPGGFNLLPGEPPVGPTPPALVGDFNATDGEDRQSTLSWTNPADGDLGQVVVQRKTGSYPTSHTDGTTVYNDETPIPGAAISGEVDSSLVNETTYYYAVFSRDASDWDDTVTEGSNADTGAPTEPAPPGDAVGYWQLNEESGTTAADSSGNGNHGTIYGASWVSGSPDESWALSFDGVNDYVQVPNAASLNPASALTIEAWIKPDVVPPASEKQQVIVEKPYTSAAAPYYQYCLTMWGTEIVLYVSVDGQLEYVVSTGAGLTAGTWTHVAGVYDGQDLKVYVDGTLRGTANVGAGTISAYSTPMLIGKHGNFAIDQFSGTMDEVRIHAEALVPGGFNLLPGEPPVGPTPPALVGDFNATDGEDRQSTLSWTNPADGDLGQVVVQRKTGSYPTSHTDGTTVYNDETPIPGAAISGEVDSSLVNETTYYYAVFSRDASDWDDTVTEGSNADTGAPTEPAPPGDAVGYWQLNEESGTTAADSSGNGNHGTIYGASWVSGSPDESWALSFDGVNDYVQVPNAASLNPASALTIEAWIKPDVVPPASEKQQVIVEKPYTSAAAPYYQYCLTMWGTEIVLYVSVDGQLEYVVSTGAGLTAGTWTHVAGVYDGQDLKVYVDGTLRGTANVGAGTISAYSTPMLIGKHGNFAIDQFSGTMDEVRIHAEALVPGGFNLLPLQALSIMDTSLLTARALRALVVPNPVDNVGTFEVTGITALELAVWIYDLSGARVFDSGWQPGSTLVWDRRNDWGERLANGPYIYVIQTRQEDGIERIWPPQKLFLR